jgi:DNA-binding LytR/AlgR family response regulator
LSIAVTSRICQFHDSTEEILCQSKEKKTAIKVDTFDNGDSLLNSLSYQPYDLIFLDIIMPMLSGIDTCAEIRKENRQTKIIFLSVSPEFGVDAFRVKANGYLLKPIEPNALSKIMNEYLAERKSSSRYLIAKTMSMIRKVPLHTISYMEAQNKRILLYTVDGNTLSIPFRITNRSAVFF